MRPLELVVEGFRSFGQRTVFDWRGRRLVGIVGPIGSGKSSILDAIAFALYGKTPVFESGTKVLIKQNLDTARVELAFEVEGETWRAVRVIRQRGASQHALYREVAASPGQQMLAGFGDLEPAAVPEVEKEREVNARVEELLGLDFQAFCRSVLLAQNRFAEFLNATPGLRDKVLKGVFGFDRIDTMHALAKQRRGAAELDVKELQGRLGAVEDDRQRLAALQAAAQRSAQRAERLAEAAERVAELDETSLAALKQRQEAEAGLTELGEFTEQLPSPGRVDTILGAASAAEAAAAEAEKVWKSARLAVASAEEAQATTAAEVGSGEQLVRAEGLIESLETARENLTEARRSHRAIEAWVATAEAELPKAVERRDQQAASARQAEEAATAAAREAEAAEEGLHQAQHLEMALSLRQALQEGEPCPVCEQPVDRAPPGAPSPAVDAARRRRAASRDALTAAESARTEAVRRGAALEEAVVSAERARNEAGAQRQESLARLERAEATCKDLQTDLAELVGVAAEGDPMTFIRSARSRLATAAAQLDTAREREREAAGEAEQARQAIEAARQEQLGLGNRLAGLAGRLGWEATDEEDLAPPADLLVEIEQRLTDRRQTAEQALRDAGRDHREAAEERSAITQDLELADDASFAKLLSEARSAQDRDSAKLAEIERRLEQAAEVEQRLDQATQKLTLYQQLADDLSAANFLRYLLDEERNALAELGSRRFEMLSGGRYRFTGDATFSIVDLANAEKVRKAGTLSGGETFLASLALALALAEKVVGSGGRLDAFFLDEGFGSLDQEHLDLALEGIERLVSDAPSRLVVIVSHVGELRDRIEDLIELDKDPAGGDTIVRRGASLS
ncbi:MAG: SMC family ATPase [Acidobacteriota bacterium]